MEILEKVSGYLLASIFFAPVIKLVVDLFKPILGPFVSEIKEFFYYFSAFTGTLLGLWLLPELGFNMIEGGIIGLVAGSWPAPMIHDWLKVLRRIKELLKEWGNTGEEHHPEFPL